LTKATKVLAMTMGLIIGPASIYATQQDSGKPLRSSRRMIGTMPHSHIGKIKPSNAHIEIANSGKVPNEANAAAISRSSGFFGLYSPETRRAMNCCGTTSSRMPAIIAPRTMNGSAS